MQTKGNSFVHFLSEPIGIFDLFLRSKVSVAVISIPVPEKPSDDDLDRRSSVASSYVSEFVDEDGKTRRYSDVLAPRFSIRDAPLDEGVVTAIENESPRQSLQPPSRRSSRPSSRESQRSERSVSFSKDVKGPKPGPPTYRVSRRNTPVVIKEEPVKARRRPDSRASSTHSRSPKRDRKKRHKKRATSDGNHDFTKKKNEILLHQIKLQSIYLQSV